MQRIKALILGHFEGLVVVTIFGGVLLMNYFVVQKAAFLNFYFLPALVAGYVLGKRMALLTSALCIGLVTLFMKIAPDHFALGESAVDTGVTLVLWGGFLVLTSYVVGSLYERNEEKVRQLKQAYVGVLEILSKYIEGNDRYTMSHSMRVSQLATVVAKAMKLSDREIENCRVGGLLHDIGKVEISMDLIRRAAALTDAEKEVVATHAERGARMIDTMGDILKDVVPIIECHHTFYRDGDKENTHVPLESFIVAVADTYDAIVTDRPYRAGKPPFQAVVEIEKGSGTQFHPAVVAAFKRVIASRIEEQESQATAPPVSVQ